MRKFKVLSAAKVDIFTQGVIFNNAFAHGFNGLDAYGLVITARCDIAQRKIPHIHYCPIVSVSDWINVFGWLEIKNRIVSNAIKSMEKCLVSSGKSKDIMRIESPGQVYKVHFLDDEGVDKKNKKIFKSHLDRYVEASAAIGSSNITTAFGGELHTYVKEIVGNKITGLSFLEDVDVHGDARGYVVLLREVNKISASLTQQVKSGLTPDAFKAHCDKHPEDIECLCFPNDEICCPCSIVNSPFIEYIMQQFGLLFSRIGVDDVDERYVDDICQEYATEAKQ